MRIKFVAYCLLAFVATGPAEAADCRGNPGALGTSRTIAVDPAEHQFLGAFQYRESLPLDDREVVITFDDGPLPPYSGRVLDILAAECVKATFFMVGRMARTYPQLVKRAHAEGHTLANHSQNHPLTFHRMTVDQAKQEVEDGFASIRAALGEPGGVSDFFRIPGLLRQEAVETYLSSKGYMTWSVDFMADDWRRIRADEIVRRALHRLESRGKGILLLHDIQPATAVALPTLLRELKARGYKIVHVVQANPEQPKTATLPEQWTVARASTAKTASGIWPHVQIASVTLPPPVLEAPSVNNFGIADPTGTYEHGWAAPVGDRLRADDREVPLPPVAMWPPSVHLVVASATDVLPAPDATNFRYSRVWKPHLPVTRAARKPIAKKDGTTASTATSAPKGTTGTIGTPTRGVTGPRPARPVGHQIQLPKPTASLSQRPGPN